MRTIDLNRKIKNNYSSEKFITKQLNILKKWSDSFQDFYPFPSGSDFSQDYWNCKIGVHEGLVKDASFDVRKAIIQLLVNGVIHLMNTKKQKVMANKSQVMCLISIPDMFSSELTIFFDKEYYDFFFLRNNSEQKWISIDNNQRSILKEYDIHVPETIALQERGYVEIRNDEDSGYYQGEIWAIGECGEWE